MTGAPALAGQVGSLVSLLDALLDANRVHLPRSRKSFPKIGHVAQYFRQVSHSRKRQDRHLNPERWQTLLKQGGIRSRATHLGWV